MLRANRASCRRVLWLAPRAGAQLTDDEIAQVLTFVRSAWGNRAAAVTADQVRALRPFTDPSSDRVIVLKMR